MVDAAVPAVARAHRRVLDEVGEVDRERQIARQRARVQAVGHRARAGRARARRERAAPRSGRRTSSCSVTPPGAGVRERAAFQPPQRSGRVDAGQHVGDQRRGDHAGDAREREHVARKDRRARPPTPAADARAAAPRRRPAPTPASARAAAAPSRSASGRPPAQRAIAAARRSPRRPWRTSSERDSCSESGGQRQLDARPSPSRPRTSRARARRGRRRRRRRSPAATAAASSAGSRRARSCARTCRSGPAGAPSLHAPASACSTASGTGVRSRASTANGVQPASPRRRISRSSMLLPIPPGPWTSSTPPAGEQLVDDPQLAGAADERRRCHVRRSGWRG